MADNTVLNTGSGGDTIATDDIGGVKHQRVKVEYGADGSATDVSATNPLPVRQVADRLYKLIIPPSAVAASKIHCDMFNATWSGKTVRIVSALIFPLLDAAVTGTLGVRLHLTRTTAVGTGGTAATTDDTSLTVATFCELDTTLTALPAQITARLAPGGGATAGAHLSIRNVFTEETNAGTAAAAALGTDFIAPGSAVYVAENAGIRIVQGTVASVGSVFFEVLFELI